MMWVVLQLLVWTVNFSSLATRVYFELRNADCIQKVCHIDIDLLSAKSIETSSKVITMEELRHAREVYQQSSFYSLCFRVFLWRVRVVITLDTGGCLYLTGCVN